MIIRNAVSGDYENIYNLVKTAFETAKVSDGTEQDFVLELRKSNVYIKDLEFVAEFAGRLIGHIMLTEQPVIAKPYDIKGVLLAPLCVDIKYRSRGVGGSLINYALAQALLKGYKAAFLVGDLEYYMKYGFSQISDSNIKNLSVYPDKHVLMRELERGCLKDIVGTIKII